MAVKININELDNFKNKNSDKKIGITFSCSYTFSHSKRPFYGGK